MSDSPPRIALSANHSPATRSSHIQAAVLPFTGHKFLVLFLFLLAYLVLYPFVGESPGGHYYLFRTLGVVVTLVTVYAVSFRKGLIFIAVFLAVPAIVEHSIFFRTEFGSVSVVNILLAFVFDVFVIVVIFRRVYARDRPTAETIFGALCVYLLIGFTFARIYAITAALQPHAFYLDPTTNPHTAAVGFDFIFFSFGSMTTAGSGGITAVSPQVRSLSVIESILGVLYLAVMISRLIDAYQPGHPDSAAS